MNLDEFFDAVEAARKRSRTTCGIMRCICKVRHGKRRRRVNRRDNENQSRRTVGARYSNDYKIKPVRAIDLPNWSQTGVTKSYKKHGINN